jgi:hypothetical protein
MKIKTFLTLSVLGISASQAGYVIKIPLSNEIKFNAWNGTTSLFGEWSNTGSPYDCLNWNPDVASINIGQVFMQTTNDCKQNQVRTVQERELDKVSGNVRNVGAPYTATQVIQASNTKSAVGTKESWASTTSTYTTWNNDGEIINCSNWSPAPSTVTIGTSYTQTATDCQQPQTRSRQDREKESTTQDIRNKGIPVIENQLVIVSSTRSTLGSKETWIAAAPTYTTWANDGTVLDCSNWSPAPATVTVGESFIQTATDCNQPQTRTRQDREQETTTLVFRNKDVAVIEKQNIVASSTRDSTGSKETWSATTSTYTTWTNNGALTSCSNWSPAPSTVTVGTSYTQTATDCQQPQIRSKQDREQETTTLAIRNKGVAVTESQSITASSTRTATGTKESWVATTSTYTAWTNNGALTSCSNWSPSASTVTVGQAFTQTATDCQQAQTRSRQDREQETTTLAIRNKGVDVTENQTIAATSTRPATGSKETWVAATPTYTTWTNNGVLTSCSNWSPAPDTVTVGTNYTQTATDCQQPQTRSRQDREQETTSLTIRNKGTSVTESQSITASSTRTATGTKETWVATTSTYTTWINNGVLTSCSNWSPATSTITLGQSFTQTATDCQQPQTRSRQDREQETTTLTIRNKGVAVTENKTIAANSTRTATGTSSKECLPYTISDGAYSLVELSTPASSYAITLIWWKNTMILNVPNRSVTFPYQQGGYKYSLGGFSRTDSIYGYVTDSYGVCREKI